MNDKKFSQLIREAVRATGKSVYQLSYAACLKESAIRRFLNGQQGVNTKSLDAIIAAAFPDGVAIVPSHSEQLQAGYVAALVQ
ncbi:MAG TPA: hypothetical protein VGG19_16525 [Tepidisphaeraceae bacterium]